MYEILVVDDTPANLQLLTGILSAQGYAVRSAPNGCLALRSVAVKAPNLILLDVKMPELDGFEVCRRLKAEEHSCRIPVIFISALDETVDKVKGFDVGGVDYIGKPFQPEEVLARVGVQLRIRQLTDKLREANETLESRVEQRTAELANTNAELEAEIAGRVKVQEALRESEERFRSIFDSTATPMAILSPTGNVQQVNPACCMFYGYTEEEFSRLNVLDVTHPDDRPRTSALYGEALSGKREDAVYEKRYLRKDGTIRWGHTSMAPVTDEQGQVKYFVALTQDITERKEAEVVLLESERRLATLMSNLPGMAYRCRNDRDWTMLFVSEGCRVLTGYEPEELLDNRSVPYNDLIHPDDRESLWQQIESSVKDEHPFELEYRIRTANGEKRWVWERGRGVFGPDGTVLALEGFITDITDRKQTEAAAKTALGEAEEAREKIDAILKSVVDGLIVADLSGRVVLMNRAAEKLLGTTLVEAFSRPVDVLLAGDGFGAQVLSVQEGRKEPSLLEWEITDQASANPRTIQSRTATVRNRGGKTIGTITLLRDVSRERDLDRMKNEFISTAAHELRTPLTAVLGFSEVLLKQQEFGVTDSAQQMKMISIIHEKAVRLETIVSELLDLSRIQSGQMISLNRASFDIVQLLERAVSHYRQGKAGHRFEVSLPEEAIVLAADAGKLEQVLENLLSNAIKFSKPQSTIRVTGQVTGPSFLIAVTDEGIGMTPDQLERVFDKFYRADASNTAVEGLGLGMSIAKSIVEGHGGEIQVESEPGHGTTVSFAIPLE